jgi:hypothetical protein
VSSHSFRAGVRQLNTFIVRAYLVVIGLCVMSFAVAVADGLYTSKSRMFETRMDRPLVISILLIVFGRILIFVAEAVWTFRIVTHAKDRTNDHFLSPRWAALSWFVPGVKWVVPFRHLITATGGRRLQELKRWQLLDMFGTGIAGFGSVVSPIFGSFLFLCLNVVRWSIVSDTLTVVNEL